MPDGFSERSGEDPTPAPVSEGAPPDEYECMTAEERQIARLSSENARLTQELADGEAADADRKASMHQLEADVSRLEAGDAISRKGWWLSHGCDGLYGDDGEMQCGKCMVDFKRLSPAEIEAGLLRASAARLRAQLVSGDPR